MESKKFYTITDLKKIGGFKGVRSPFIDRQLTLFTPEDIPREERQASVFNLLPKKQRKVLKLSAQPVKISEQSNR